VFVVASMMPTAMAAAVETVLLAARGNAHGN